MNDNNKLQPAVDRVIQCAKNVCDHWAEFGPEFGFDESMEWLFRAMDEYRAALRSEEGK
jgi:hypothetical protein